MQRCNDEGRAGHHHEPAPTTTAASNCSRGGCGVLTDGDTRGRETGLTTGTTTWTQREQREAGATGGTNRGNEGNGEGEGLAAAHMKQAQTTAVVWAPGKFFYVRFLFFFFQLTYVLIYYRSYLCYNNTTSPDPTIYHRCKPLLTGWLGGAMGWDDDTTRTQIAHDGQLTTRPHPCEQLLVG